MNIIEIEIRNFRILKHIKLKPEPILSLIIGKNNSGKTAVLDIFNNFFKRKDRRFSFDDFNIDTHVSFKKLLNAKEEELLSLLNIIKIELKIYIEYVETDSTKNISNYLLNLDPKDNIFVLAFEYGLRVDKIDELKKAFGIFAARPDNAYPFGEPHLVS